MVSNSIFFVQKIQIIGKGQSVAMRTAANDNQIILKGSFFAKRTAANRFFAKDPDHPEGPGFAWGRLPKTIYFAKEPDHMKLLVFCKEDGCK